MPIHSDALLLLGALLLLAIPASRLATWLRLPSITGHLAAGLLLGGFGLVSESTRPLLDATIALVACFIVFYVGTLMRPKLLRQSAPGGIWIGVVALALVTALVFGIVSIPGAPWHGSSPRLVLLAGLVLGTTSPTIAGCVLAELRARGPLSRTVLISVLVSDFAALGCVVAIGAFETSDAGFGALGGALLGTCLAIAIGIAVGFIAGRVASVWAWFALAVALLGCTLLGRVSGLGATLGPMLGAGAAGVAFAAGRRDETELPELRSGLGLASGLLFAAVGATMNLTLLWTLLVPAILLAALRAASLYLAARIGSKIAHCPLPVARWSFTGLLPQAGFTLALAQALPDVVPASGGDLIPLLVAVVCLNELFTPPLLRLALERTHERFPLENRLQSAA